MAFDVVEEAARRPEGVMTADLARVAGRDVAYDLEDAKADGALVSLAGLWLTPSAWEACAPRLVAALDGLHASEPRQLGWVPDVVCEAAGLKWTGNPARRAFDRLAAAGLVRIFEDLVALTAFRPHLSERQDTLLARVVEELGRHGLDTPGPKEAADLIGVPRHAVEEIMRIGVGAGDLVMVNGSYFPTALVDQILQETRQEFGDNGFAVGEWRDAMGVSRRVAVAWLEHFDEVGQTQKEGDLRRLSPKTR